MKDVALDADRELASEATDRMTNIMKKMYSPRNFAAPPQLELELNSKAAQRSGGCLTERVNRTSCTRSDHLTIHDSASMSRKAETSGFAKRSSNQVDFDA